VVQELRDLLPDLITEALNVPEIGNGLARVRLPAKVMYDETLGQADELLAITTPEMSRLQEARRRLAAHEGERPVGAFTPPDITLASVFGAYLGLVAVAAILAVDGFAQAMAWAPAFRVAGLVGSIGFALGITIVAILLVLVAAVPVEKGLGATYVDAEERSALGTAVALMNAYPILLWRLWGPTGHWLRSGWAALGWSVVGVGVLVLIGFLIFAYLDINFLVGQGTLLLRGVAISVVVVGAGVGIWQVRDYLFGSRFGAGATAVAWGVVVAVMIFGTVLIRSQITLAARDTRLKIQQRKEWLASPARRQSSGGRRVGISSINWYTEERNLRQAASAALADWRVAIRERAIVPFLRRRLNEILEPNFSVKLDIRDAPGLRQMRSRDYIVATRVFDRFRRQLRQIDGGAIGVAGPRGVGKTTLLEACQEGMFLEPGQRPHLAFTESVPVKYEAREFVLHLYARLCESVIEFASALGVGRPRLRARLRRAIGRYRRPILYVAGWTTVATIGAEVLRGRQNLRTIVADAWWPLIIFVGVVGLFLVIAHRPVRRPDQVASRNMNPASLAELHASAIDRLVDVRFQQRFTSGWSGKLSLPFGSESSMTRSREITKVGRSYPEVVDDFRRFLRITLDVLDKIVDLPPIRVIIIIDELDKIPSSENAQNFVNELKALFSLDRSGYLFLVSVSEEALTSFDRGLPMRDAFDSAFDEISRVEYLTLNDTYSLLRTRVIGLAETFLCLGHCLAGGLPREIIRVARDIVGQVEPGAPLPTLGAVAKTLVTEDLHNKISGLRSVIARTVTREPYASDLLRHLDGVVDNVDIAILLAAVAKPPIDLTPKPNEPNDADVDALARLQIGTLGYLYLGATLLQVFTDELNETQLALGRDETGDGSFDTLASIRQLFSVNARLAWLTLNAFRARWSLDTIAPPAR